MKRAHVKQPSSCSATTTTTMMMAVPVKMTSAFRVLSHAPATSKSISSKDHAVPTNESDLDTCPPAASWRVCTIAEAYTYCTSNQPCLPPSPKPRYPVDSHLLRVCAIRKEKICQIKERVEERRTCIISIEQFRVSRSRYNPR